MTDPRKNLCTGMLILFVTGILSIPLALMTGLTHRTSGLPLSVLVNAVELVAAVILLKTGRSEKFRPAVFGAVATLLMGCIQTEPTRVLGAKDVLLLAASLLFAFVKMYGLYAGTAEVMAAEGHGEAAASGRFAVKLHAAMSILLLAETVVYAVLISSNSVSAGMLVLGISPLFLIILVILSIVNLVVRLTFFGKCRKLLLAQPPEPPAGPEE